MSHGHKTTIIHCKKSALMHFSVLIAVHFVMSSFLLTCIHSKGKTVNKMKLCKTKFLKGRVFLFFPLVIFFCFHFTRCRSHKFAHENTLLQGHESSCCCTVVLLAQRRPSHTCSNTHARRERWCQTIMRI